MEDCGVREAGFVFSVKVFSECGGGVTDVELVISYPQGQADIVWCILGLQIVIINYLGFIIGGYHLGKVSTLAHFMATDAGWVV